MKRISLATAFVVASLAVLLVVSGAFFVFLRTSHASILDASERARGKVASQVEREIVAELGRAQRALEDIDKGIAAGAIGLTDMTALEADLFTRMIADPHLEEATFTHADLLGYDAKGEADLGPENRWQISIVRTVDGRLVTRLTQRIEGDMLALVRDRPLDAPFLSTSFRREGKAVDPTTHFTFSVLASKARRGRAIWSDLHWAEADQTLPQPQRRVVLSVQKAVEDRAGHFLGVLRVALLTTEIDSISRVKMGDAAAGDPHRIALLSASSADPKSVRLVARVDPSDHVETFGDDVRMVSDRPPPEIAALLGSPLLANLDLQHPNREGSLDVGGERHLATLRELTLGPGGTEGWFAAIIVPASYYTRDLVRIERVFLVAFGLTLALVIAIGALTLLAIRGGLARIARTTQRMRDFQFSSQKDQSIFLEVDEVMKGLERAKTVARAMGKYIPMDLVQRLYQSNEDPSLGGEQHDVSMMFTDIEGFTTLSEKLPPAELARRLGDYLEAMTVAIQATGGTIDKYIGDAVMALWNVPTPVEDHAKKACRGALDCMAAARALYASPAWAGLPALVTRFGLHRADVLVGNFGAPTRLSYTALGDGVNLAARLEPLCKQYGVVVLVIEVIARDAAGAFFFRRIDRVAVKGKTTGIDVYELLGAAGDDIPNRETAKVYEDAFTLYLARDFSGALALLAPQKDADSPSAVLHARCLLLRDEPPADGWNGVHVASSK